MLPFKTGEGMRFSGKGYFKYPSLFFGQSDPSILISLPVSIVTVPPSPSVLCWQRWQPYTTEPLSEEKRLQWQLLTLHSNAPPSFLAPEQL